MMDRPSSDSGYELVLDNRRLIVAFAILVLIFGCFFVLGFMEGKRQGYQAGAQIAAETGANPAPAQETPVPQTSALDADAAMEPPKEPPDEQPLGWYKSVSGKGEKPEIAPPPPVPSPAPEETATRQSVQPAVKPPAKTAASTPSSYSVQVGAFRQKKQVDAKAEALRSKGFDCRIEPPESDEGLYLLKVGRFKSRADAVAMQLRLKKSGFSSFIKTN
jgi:cell division protein FtsN